MEALTPYVSWLGGVVGQIAQPILQAVVKAPAAAPAPIPVVAVASPTPTSLGLKLLLDPITGGLICRAASNTVATIYPVYASAKAIESKEHADDVQWLTYWTLYGSIILVEHLADKALGKIPYYYHAKLTALLWLQLPQTRGAAYLYNRFYKPALVKYGPRVDAVLAKGQTVLASLYAAHKVPIDAVVAMLLELRKQAAATFAWLLSDNSAAAKGATGDRDGTKANPA